MSESDLERTLSRSSSSSSLQHDPLRTYSNVSSIRPNFKNKKFLNEGRALIAKYIFLTLNILFVLLSISLIILAIYLLVKPGDFLNEPLEIGKSFYLFFCFSLFLFFS